MLKIMIFLSRLLVLFISLLVLRFEEEGHAEQKYNHFRLTDLTGEELYPMGVPAILDEEEE